jgi:hypothetical protein
MPRIGNDAGLSQGARNRLSAAAWYDQRLIGGQRAGGFVNPARPFGRCAKPNQYRQA